jgi:hypothetical protein
MVPLIRELEATPTAEIERLNTYLYLVLGNGKALRYGIGVGRDGFTWSGAEKDIAHRHVRGGRVVECGCRADVEVLHPGGQRGGGGLRSGGSAVPTKEAPVCAGAEDCEVGFAGVPDLQAYNLNSRCRVLVP